MDADVVVVGAGPTGLLLAGDLAEAGVAVTVLERRTDESNVTRAFAVHARTMEELDIRGVAGELAKTGTQIRQLQLFDRVQIDLSTLPSDFASLLITPQYETERVLAQRAAALGVRIIHGAEVTGVTQDADGVDVTLPTARYRASYVVGADGVNSAVRRALGLPFPGRSVIKSIMLADVRLSAPPGDVLAVNGVGDAFAFVAPFGDGWYRIFAWNRRHQVDDKAPVDLDEIREVIGQMVTAIPPVATAAAGTISGIGIRYPAPPGADRRVGTRMSNIPLAEGRLYEALRGGRFVLITPEPYEVDLPAQVDVAVPARPTGELLLVRPDGYLAWAGTAPEFPAWASRYFCGSSRSVHQSKTE